MSDKVKVQPLRRFEMEGVGYVTPKAKPAMVSKAYAKQLEVHGLVKILGADKDKEARKADRDEDKAAARAERDARKAERPADDDDEDNEGATATVKPTKPHETTTDANPEMVEDDEAKKARQARIEEARAKKAQAPQNKMAPDAQNKTQADQG